MRSRAGQAGYLDGITYAAGMMSARGSATTLIDQVSSLLVYLLSLRSCAFQYGVAGLGQPALLHRDGSVTIGQRRWAADSEGSPADTGPELRSKTAASSRAGSW